MRTSRLLPDSRLRITVDGRSTTYKVYRLKGKKGWQLWYLDLKTWQVKSYTITYTDKEGKVVPICSCPDAKYRKPHNCKHILGLHAHEKDLKEGGLL